MAEVTKDLREIHARLVEVFPKRTNAEAVLARMEIRSPYAGRVVGLSVFSIGGVIQRGEKILDVVPDEDGLTVDVQVAVEDISDVHPDSRAELHLTAYKQRVVPTIHGTVVTISADRLSDPKTNNSYFVASIRPDAAELAALPGVRLYPGMPVSVMIPTESRTAFDYLVGPLTMSFKHAFRQK
jgi:HlyD family type I secretion membrane fusion protein